MAGDGIGECIDFRGERTWVARGLHIVHMACYSCACG